MPTTPQGQFNQNRSDQNVENRLATQSGIAHKETRQRTGNAVQQADAIVGELNPFFEAAQRRLRANVKGQGASAREAALGDLERRGLSQSSVTGQVLTGIGQSQNQAIEGGLAKLEGLRADQRLALIRDNLNFNRQVALQKLNDELNKQSFLSQLPGFVGSAASLVPLILDRGNNDGEAPVA